MKNTFRNCNIIIISACALRFAVLTPLYTYISYLYSYIESTPLGIFVAFCEILSDFLVSLAVFATLAGMYFLVRAKLNKKAFVCALVFLFSNLAGSATAYFAESLLVRAGLSDLTEAMFAYQTPYMISSALYSLGALILLLFFTFIFALALKPASDRGARLFALLSYTAGRLVAECIALYAKIAVGGAPVDVFEVISLALPFIEQGVFAVAGYYIIKALS